MHYARKLILHAPPWDSPLLEGFVAACLRDSVALVCVVGDDCERVHDVIDELIASDGAPERRNRPATTWHANESFTEVRDFAEAWRVEGDEHAAVAEVTLSSAPVLGA